MSLDFGPVKCASLSLRELHRASLIDARERLKAYRRYVYEAGALDHPQKGQGRVIKNDMVEHERKNDFELNRIRRFRYRTRYFTDSGIIGTKDFVQRTYHRVQEKYDAKREKMPKPIGGLGGIYSLKRLTK